MSNELISEIRMLIVGNHSMAIGSTEAAKQIAEKCSQATCEAVDNEKLLLGSNYLISKKDAIEAISKAFKNDFNIKGED